MKPRTLDGLRGRTSSLRKAQRMKNELSGERPLRLAEQKQILADRGFWLHPTKGFRRG